MYPMLVNSVDTGVEIGPGRALSGFIKKTSKSIHCLPVETVEELEAVVAMLKALNAGEKPLIVTAEADPKLVVSARNIPGVRTAVVGALNSYDVLRSGKLVMAASAAEKIEEVYSK